MNRAERRRHERVRVRFPCQIELEAGAVGGTVSDLSFGGLSVESEGAAEQGESVRVRLQPPGKPPIEIEALVWHVRRGRNRKTGAVLHRLGLVLSEAPADFEMLVRGRSPRSPGSSPRNPRGLSPRPEQTTAEKVAPRCHGNPPPPSVSNTEAPLQRFRARVSRNGTSRTRTILVFAASTDQAEDKALIEVGDDWSLLEISEV